MMASFDVHAGSSFTLILAFYSISDNILVCRCYTQFMLGCAMVRAVVLRPLIAEALAQY